MISICIPVFNFNITTLVKDLYEAAEPLKIPYEIIIIDDGSEKYKEINKKAGEKFNYIELVENIGRSKIRNSFLDYAKYDYLLFLDCDSLITAPDFLTNYIAILKRKPAVVVGGREYDKKRPARKYLLRWKYGRFRESKPASVRSQNPYASFMTNNFLINMDILKETRFDTRLVRYGHEDTLFGYSLKKNKIPIIHIDNTILNGEIELNEEYLDKTHESVKSLIQILHIVDYDLEFIKSVSVLNFYNKIKMIRGMIYRLFILFKPMILFLLKNGFINLHLFDFYKLGILIEYIKLKEKLPDLKGAKAD